MIDGPFCFVEIWPVEIYRHAFQADPNGCEVSCWWVTETPWLDQRKP